MNPTTVFSKRNPWPYAIILYFIVFILFIAGFIAWAVRQNVDLVRPDYYQDEILFQKQIDTLHRTLAVAGQVAVNYDLAGQAITIQLPPAHAVQGITGSIHLYRPSDAKLDREVKLAVSDKGAQRIESAHLEPGLWKVRVQWKANGQEFCFDQRVIIGG